MENSRKVVGSIPIEFSIADPRAAEGTRREHEVLEHLCESKSNKEIAAALNISERTVKFHVGNLFKANGVASRAALIAKLRTP